MGYTERTVQAVVAVDLPGQSGFGVEEVKLLVDVKVLQCMDGGIPFVVLTIHLVGDVAVLHVGIGAQSLA